MKIDYEKASYIIGYKNKHFFKKFLCIWNIKQTSPESYKVECKINFLVFIVSFIPIILFQIIYNMWDCGLRNGNYIPERTIVSYNYYNYDSAFHRIKELNIFKEENR